VTVIEISFESQLRDLLRQTKKPTQPKGIVVGGSWYADGKARLVEPWAKTATVVEPGP
jgi:hypothetical protein